MHQIELILLSPVNSPAGPTNRALPPLPHSISFLPTENPSVRSVVPEPAMHHRSLLLDHRGLQSLLLCLCSELLVRVPTAGATDRLAVIVPFCQFHAVAILLRGHRQAFSSSS